MNSEYVCAVSLVVSDWERPHTGMTRADRGMRVHPPGWV